MRAAPGEHGGETVAARYAVLVAAGDIRGDDAQADVARRFDDLSGRLVAASEPGASGLMARLRRQRAEPVRGVYLHGEVGRGKTMLMDLFHDQVHVRRKRRSHYNEFMGEVHDRVHAVRLAAPDSEPIGTVATAIAKETRLLCLDEFAVTDIADAMILSRLFGDLFGAGVTLVATSNARPDELYRDGLNRALFLPFLDLLTRSCDVVALKGETDYRLEKLTGGEVYVTPLGPSAARSLDATFRRLTGRDHGEAAMLRIRGRDIPVPQAASGVGRFRFVDLCEAPLAAGDYVAVARAFHTLVIDDIPVIRAEQRDVARRLVLLVDTLYDHRVNLVASAAVEPGQLCAATSGDVASAFKRTISRLMEMRSAAYIGAPHRIAVLADESARESLAPEHQSG